MMAQSSNQKRRTLQVVATRMGLSPRNEVTLVIIGLTVLFFLVASDQWISVVNYTLIFAITALALNVLTGYAGQVSLGITFFMALGAYTAAWLGGFPPDSSTAPLGLGLPFYVWLPAAGIVAAIGGALVGPIALRLKNFYLGIVTLALVFIGQYVFKNARGLTGGPQGRSIQPPMIGDFSLAQQNQFAGIALTKEQQFFVLLLLVLGLASLFVHNVMRSRAGRAFQAVRDNETGAAIMGVNLFQAKLGAFVLSSFLAGISGALLASYTGYVRPDYWSFPLSIQFVAAIIVGGIASVWGSILGAAFVFALPQVIDQLAVLPSSTSGQGLTSGDLSAILYGFLVILFLLFEPGGVIGLVRRVQVFSNRIKLPKGGDEVTSAAGSDDVPSTLDVERSPIS